MLHMHVFLSQRSNSADVFKCTLFLGSPFISWKILVDFSLYWWPRWTRIDPVIHRRDVSFIFLLIQPEKIMFNYPYRPEWNKSHNRHTLVQKVTAQHYLWTLSHHVSLKNDRSLVLHSHYLWRISYIARASWSAPLVNWHLVSRGVGVRFLSERWALVRVSGLWARHRRVWLDRLVAIQMFCGKERHVRPQKILLHCPHC